MTGYQRSLVVGGRERLIDALRNSRSLAPLAERANDFEEPWVVTTGEPVPPISVVWRDRPHRSTQLERHVLLTAASLPGRTTLVADPDLRPTDPFVASISRPIVHTTETVAYLVQADEAPIALLDTLGDVPFWSLTGAVLDREVPAEHAQQQGLQDLLDTTALVFAAAWDGEGLIFAGQRAPA